MARCRDLHFEKFGFLGTRKSGKLESKKIPKIKIVKIEIGSAQNVGKVFYAGKKRPRPIWGPPGQFFAWAGKIQKLPKFCLFSLVGPWALFTRFGALAAIHPRWGNRYFRDVGGYPRPTPMESKSRGST